MGNINQSKTMREYRRRIRVNRLRDQPSKHVKTMHGIVFVMFAIPNVVFLAVAILNQ